MRACELEYVKTDFLIKWYKDKEYERDQFGSKPPRWWMESHDALRRELLKRGHEITISRDRETNEIIVSVSGEEIPI